MVEVLIVDLALMNDRACAPSRNCPLVLQVLFFAAHVDNVTATVDYDVFHMAQLLAVVALPCSHHLVHDVDVGRLHGITSSAHFWAEEPALEWGELFVQLEWLCVFDLDVLEEVWSPVELLARDGVAVGLTPLHNLALARPVAYLDESLRLWVARHPVTLNERRQLRNQLLHQSVNEFTPVV